MSTRIEELSILELQALMDAGKLSSGELVLHLMERVSKLDKAGPRINSVLEINPDAYHIALALDHERSLGLKRGPLHGIPVLIKDNIDTGDKMHTTAGSLAIANNIAKEDAFVVQKLRESGAVIFGKANMTEWANFMTKGMPNGYSSRGGQVLNPYGPGIFDVGGSSSGSGAAVAAGFATVALGTETSGSILSPANENSVVGIKPTVGLVSRSGVIPIAFSQDTVGPLARTVTDAAIVLEAIAGVDLKDPSTRLSADRIPTKYASFLREDALKNARIGVSFEYFKRVLNESLQKLFIKAIEGMQEAGAIIIDDISFPPSEVEWDYNILIYEFKVGLNNYLINSNPNNRVRSLADVIEFNRNNREKCLKYGQYYLLEAERTSGTLTEWEYVKSRRNGLDYAQKKGINQTMEKYNLDAIITPGPMGAYIPAKAGYPSINVPCGYGDQNQPFGITFTSRAFEEPKLISLAYSFEQAMAARKAPEI
ncbi:MAG: amidase [Firmicutes bacterium]|nr:amidase [Bacillota bacterium]